MLLTHRWFVVLFVLLVPKSQAIAAEPTNARIDIFDGRAFRGVVDDRSNDTRLWIHTHCAGITLARPIAWNAIRTITIGQQTFSAEEFRTQLKQFASPAPALNCEPTPAAEPRRTPEPVSQSTPAGRVTAVQADARLVNWDADVEHDGLIVTVAPLDEWGQLRAVDGSVEIELIGEGPGTTAALSTFPTLGRWVRQLNATEMPPSGAPLKLEFQAAHPEFDLRLSPYGMVHVRLSVPGHGTFETTTDLTTLRTFNPLRDRLQQQTRQRYFAQETTGVGKRPTLPVNER